MSSFVLNEIRKGFYLDSVALMRLSREVAAAPGVIEAALMMGTPANIAILREAGLLAGGTTEAGGNDLILAVRAESEAAACAAIAEAEKSLDKPKAEVGSSAAWRARTIAAALEESEGVNLALISVPGDFAAAEARKALSRGLHYDVQRQCIIGGRAPARNMPAKWAFNDGSRLWNGGDRYATLLSPMS